MSEQDSLPRFFTRQQLLELGHTPSALRNHVTYGRLERTSRGVYIATGGSDGSVETDRMAAWLHRLGPTAALSHQSAARTHGFDSTLGWPVSPVRLLQAKQNHTPIAAGFRFHRSRTLTPEMIERLTGLRTTTRSRTVLDLAARLNVLELERVVESALRGDDPRRPHEWRPEVLREIAEFTDAHPRHLGGRALAHLLRLRPSDAFPTGSLAETAIVQSARAGGFEEPVRQAKVLAPDTRGNMREHFLDALFERLRIDVETDGSSHDDPRQRQSDLARDRRLAGAVTVIRITGAEAINQPNRIIELITDELRLRESAGFGRETRFARDLVRTGTGWTVRDRQ
jgi:Protein of unknown function (DUF559)